MVERVFRRLLAMLPFDFRRDFGEEMTSVFRDEHDDVVRKGRPAVARLWMTTVTGLLTLARREHLAQWRQDVQYAFRLLRRSPGFTTAAVWSLAVGIGANAAVFGVAQAVFFDPLAIADPDRAVSINVTDSQNPGFTPLSTDNFTDVRDRITTLTGVSGIVLLPAPARINNESENLIGAAVSGTYFNAMGITPILGRALGPDDDRQGAGALVANISHAFWMRAFAGDPLVLGRTLPVNQRAFTVIGVLPAGFHGTTGVAPEIYVPLATYDTVRPGTVWSQGRRWRWLNVVGRLAPGATLEHARAEVAAIGDQLAVEYPEFNRNRSLTVLPLTMSVIGANQYAAWAQAGWMLAAVVGALLLIACTNLANLLLARNAARSREIAVRLAIGAGRLRIVRQLLTESMVLALLGGGVGLILMEGLYRWLWAARPQNLLQFPVQPQIDFQLVLFTVGLSLVAAIGFGLLPAWRLSRPNLSRALSDGGRMPIAPVKPAVRAALVSSQVALAVVALVAAGLFLSSLRRAQSIDPGFAHARLISAGYSTARARVPDEAHRLHDELLTRVRAIPGVASAAVADRLLLGGGSANTVDVPGRDGQDGIAGVLVQTAEVTPDYFDTVGIPLLAGRHFTTADVRGTPTVAIINRTMADRFWNGRDPVGEQFRTRVDGLPVQVVGVVADSKYVTLGEAPQPFFYRPLYQRPGLGTANHSLIVAQHAQTAGLSDQVRSVLRTFDPEAPAPNVAPVSDRLDTALWAPRMLATVLTAFGFIALALATGGLYGLLALTVGQRRHEFGLRMTLGARPNDVMRLVVRHGMTWVGVGLVAGVAGGAGVAHVSESLLFEAAGLDWTALLGAVALLCVVAIVACVLPARRAARVDPAEALRQ